MTDKDDDVFEYDTGRSYQSNFEEWWLQNTLEREAWHEPPLSRGQALLMFDEQYGVL